ncbi:adenosylcobinamide-phosphate synthase CbiB [Halocatena pleomorpha]|uniref:Probable cobalamin biosynthesis protein CobD n=1 Tax=Halocatena pleomorpha TaxID=1785090 RepID=A0A3P3RGC9_9EURY|nr:adenosylcobinamide-phosphate synthase CbiB [Halocatena pleomorpha]RRJ32502.1 cobalamin biosynthesis protein CobD [Halocatena pleomorpha]
MITGTLAPAASIALALVLDTTVGEFPERVHPVSWLGRMIAPFDREWSRPLVVGGIVGGSVSLLAAGSAGGVVVLVSRIHPWSGVFAAGLVLFVTTSRRLLLDTARSVVTHTATDVPDARTRLRALAGRDATALSAGQIRSGAVESAAENLSDGLVAPLCAFVVLAPVSLALGAAGATAVKAVNTLDSMLGYEHKPVGTVSARLDDLVMWIPARVSALLLAVGSPSALSTQRAWLATVPSPNAGWPMGTLAAVVDCRLEKPDVYTLNPDRPLPSVTVAHRAIQRVSRVSLLAFVLGAVLVTGLRICVAGGMKPWF